MSDLVEPKSVEITYETDEPILYAVVDGVDWICVSPKAGTTLVQTRGDELKLVFPQAENTPEDFADLAFERFSLQPMDGPDIAQSTEAAIAYCLQHPQWRLSVQTHKSLGIR